MPLSEGSPHGWRYSIRAWRLGGTSKRSRRAFPRLARNGCSLVSTATSHWFSWLRIELHFRAAAARHAKAQVMPASPPRSLCRLSPRVAMVEAAQARQRNQTGIRRWPWLDRASIGRVFVQRVVNAILLVQLSNRTPILGISVKSAIPGTHGTAGQYGCMPLW